jgi:hypothetical protein
MGTGTRVAWADTVDQYARLASEEPIALLRPNDDDRASRWSDILNWLAPSGDAPPDDVRDEGCIVCISEDVVPFGVVLAKRLGRNVFGPIEQSNLLRFVRSLDASSLIVMSLTNQLAADAIHDVVHANPRLPIGFVSGVDLPGLSFSVCKLLIDRQKPRANGGGIALIDSIRLLALANEQEWQYNTNDLLRILDGAWDVLTLSGHSEGAHCNLGPVMVCGLCGDVERARGRELTGGCTTSACKRKKSASAVPKRLISIRTRILNLFSCNSVVATPQLYPSNVSLILAALEGFATAVIGLNGNFRSRPSAPLASSLLLQSGARLGELVALLNEVDGLSSDCHPFVLFGDPTIRVPNQRPVVDARINPDSTAEPRGDGPWRIRYGRQPVPEVLHVSAESSYEAWKLRDYVLLFPLEGCADRRVILGDKKRETSRTQAELVRIAARLFVAAAVERDLVEVAHDAFSSTAGRDTLLSLARARRRTERFVWQKLGELAEAHESGMAPAKPIDVSVEVTSVLATWSEAAVGSLLFWNPPISDLRALIARPFSSVGSVGKSTSCRWCGGAFRMTRLPSLDGMTAQLTRRECSCGHLHEYTSELDLCADASVGDQMPSRFSADRVRRTVLARLDTAGDLISPWAQVPGRDQMSSVADTGQAAFCIVAFSELALSLAIEPSETARAVSR